MNEFEFEFEELPIISELGFDAGLINGTATIGYQNDGEWFVRGIALDGSRERPAADRTAERLATGNMPPRFERRLIGLDRAAHAWLYGAISDQLENGRFRDQIETKIADELAEEGISIRDDRAEHSTLNRAQQGI